MIHIATKLRNRLLKSNPMIMGHSKVSINQFYILLGKVQKSVHGLTKGDICPQDWQNFCAFAKKTSSRVIQEMQESVPNSEAVVQFLKMCHNITSSYLDHEISPLERVFRKA